MVKQCLLCKETNSLTEEHIIPQAIGGRLSGYIYCGQCNSKVGNKLDAEISKQFGSIATLLNIKRERGKSQPFEVEDNETETRLVCDGEGLRRKSPIVNIVSSEDKLIHADITARSENELQERITDIKKRYNPDESFETFAIGHPGPREITHEIIIDSELLRRSASKIAYGFLCTKLQSTVILSQPFDAIRSFITKGGKPHLAHVNFIHTQFMTDFKRPLHKIHVNFNRRDGQVIGYISLFGIFRYTVLLAENYISKLEWADLDYTFDPIRYEQVYGNDNFRAQMLTMDDVLNPIQPKELIRDDLNKGFAMLNNYIEDIKFLNGQLS